MIMCEDNNQDKKEFSITQLEQKVTSNSHKFKKCSTWWLNCLAVLLLTFIIFAMIGVAYLRVSGWTQQTINRNEEKEIINNFWGELIEFLPGALGSFSGIIIGFWCEASLFKWCRERKRRKALFILLSDELKAIYLTVYKRVDSFLPKGSEGKDSETYSALDNDKREALIHMVITIPTSLSVMNSLESSTLLNIKVNNTSLLDKLYNVISSYDWLFSTKTYYHTYSDEMKEEAKEDIFQKLVKFCDRIAVFLNLIHK